jgi:hypothetical protein
MKIMIEKSLNKIKNVLEKLLLRVWMQSAVIPYFS